MSQWGLDVGVGAMYLLAICGAGCAGHDEVDLAPGEVAQWQTGTPAGAAASGEAQRGNDGHGRRHRGPKNGPPSIDAGTVDPGDAGSADAAAGSAALRIASMGSDFPPVDVCLAPAGASQGADLVRLLAPNGLPTGVPSGQVSAYVAVSPGPYSVRFVRAGAPDCSTPLEPLGAPTLATIESGSRITLLARGSLGHLFVNVVQLVDELPGPGAAVRLVGATIPSPTIGIGLGTGDGFVPWVSGVRTSSVESPVVGSPPETDVNGYAHVPPTSGETLTVRVGAGTEFLHIPNFGVADGDVWTLFARNLPLSNFQLIACRDDPADPASPLASCTTFAE